MVWYLGTEETVALLFTVMQTLDYKIYTRPTRCNWKEGGKNDLRNQTFFHAHQGMFLHNANWKECP